jgi:hypothetical protein
VVERLEKRALLSLSGQLATRIGASGSGPVDLQVNAVTLDAAGNIFVTGSLQGTADFDPSASTQNVTNTGSRDLFVAKYSSTGALVWARSMQGADSSSVGQGSAIAVDGSGNVYVTGTFSGTVQFKPGSATFNLSAPGRNDSFLAKLDSTGSLVWALDVPGSTGSYGAGAGVTVDAQENIYAVGSFQGTVSFGSQTLSSAGNFEAFVIKLNGSGQFLWNDRPVANAA